MLRHYFRGIFTLTCALLCGLFSSQSKAAVDLSGLVVVGDSISAGVQGFSLEKDQQINGYASVIANQAKISLALPLVPYPGAPNALQLTSLNPVTITPVSGSLPPVPRLNPCEQPRNVSVPGVTLQQALTMLPGQASASPVQGWADIVLGFPSPFTFGKCPGATSSALTEVQQAVALRPTAIITWLGNNDVLVPAMIGRLDMLTPLNAFTLAYEQLLDALSQANAPILTATIPDVTKVPFFTPLSVIAAQTNMNVNKAAQKLQLDPNDLLRPPAVPIAIAILLGQADPSALTKPCTAPLALAPLSPTIPCVLKAADANTIRFTVDLFNGVIFAESVLHLAPVVDVHGLIENIAQNGYVANGRKLTTDFLGGLISLDGIHPTNTGYAIVANTFIDTMNQWWGTGIPRADVNQIAKTDPLVPPINPASLPVPKLPVQ